MKHIRRERSTPHHRQDLSELEAKVLLARAEFVQGFFYRARIGTI